MRRRWANYLHHRKFKTATSTSLATSLAFFPKCSINATSVHICIRLFQYLCNYIYYFVFYFLGWHRRFNAKAAGAKLQFYKLVPALMKEAKTVNMTVRLVEEQAVQRYQRLTYKRSQGQLSTLWDQLEAKTLKTSDFMREVGNLYSVPVHDPNEEPVDSDSEE